MTFLKNEDGIDYYIFKPSFFRLYYEKTSNDAPHRRSFTHKLHMLFYLLMGGYKVLYLALNDKIVSYLVFTRSRNLFVQSSNPRDIYTIFLWTYPEFRNRGYASKTANFLINDTCFDYDNIYKTIALENAPSLKVAEKSGFINTGRARKKGLCRRIVKASEGDFYLMKYTRSNKHL